MKCSFFLISRGKTIKVSAILILIVEYKQLACEPRNDVGPFCIMY